MRTLRPVRFQPALTPVEARVLATAGLTHSLPAHHAAKPTQAIVGHEQASKHVASHHAAAPAPAKASGSVAIHLGTGNATPPAPVPPPPVAVNAPVVQSWVELVNTTGQTLAYQVSVSTYKGGAWQPFVIGNQGVEYQEASQVAAGDYTPATIRIAFGNGQVTTLMTGPSQAAAQGYYIFLDSNLSYYVAPFISSPGGY